jgi:hypothetical protein
MKIKVRFNVYIPFGDTAGSAFGSAIGVSMRNFVGLVQSERDLCFSLRLTGPLQLHLYRLSMGTRNPRGRNIMWTVEMHAQINFLFYFYFYFFNITVSWAKAISWP